MFRFQKIQVLIILLLSLSLSSLASSKQTWEVITEASTLEFTARYDDIPFDGYFERFAVELGFDPDDPANAGLNAVIDITSVNTNSRDRDEVLADRAWFHFEQYPQATFTSIQFSRISNDRFQVTGDLTIRDKTRRINLPFQWQTLENNRVKVIAELAIDRRDYDIGNGEWAEDETIGFEVLIKISLLLEKSL